MASPQGSRAPLEFGGPLGKWGGGGWGHRLGEDGLTSEMGEDAESENGRLGRVSRGRGTWRVAGGGVVWGGVCRVRVHRAGE